MTQPKKNRRKPEAARRSIHRKEVEEARDTGARLLSVWSRSGMPLAMLMAKACASTYNLATTRVVATLSDDILVSVCESYVDGRNGTAS